MSRADDGLRAIFHKALPDFQWSAVESPDTSPGIPDSEYCAPGGASGWVEFKATRAFKVRFQPLQPGWISRRGRLGGRAFVAVRRRREAERGGVDELWVYAAEGVLALQAAGLRSGVGLLTRQSGGPRAWDWGVVRGVLTT